MGRVTLGGESGDWLQVGKWVSVGGASDSRQGVISAVAGVTHVSAGHPGPTEQVERGPQEAGAT